MSKEESMLISVITPTYNRASFLKETIDSIVNQSYKNIEYIIVDDGSTDNTEEVVKPYLEDSRVKYFKHPNMGEPKTTNRGYKLSTGEYTIVVNSDDPLHDKDYFKKVVETFRTNPEILAVYSDWANIDSKSNLTEIIKVPQYDNLSLHTQFNITLGPGMVIKREPLERIGFRDESVRYTGDLNISYKLAEMGKILHIDCCGATHRNHEGCIQHTANQKEIAKEILKLDLMIFNKDRKYIPKEILKNRINILKKALTLYQNYSKEVLKFSELKQYKSLFYNFIDAYFIYKKLRKNKNCKIIER